MLEFASGIADGSSPCVLVIVGDQLFHALHIEAVYSQSWTYSQSGQEWQVRMGRGGVRGGGGGGGGGDLSGMYCTIVSLFCFPEGLFLLLGRRRERC